ncbi:FKBP-type peptidyl-prolyl cis-trans isomerase [Enterobacteriaceae endosymbiont of Donacia thalassina]|uniref:FKBP-type peptidyl-prolyl cis-trans isomerase n=1 Tax=Enterobacteriaceae endosymbiont of Donacia thalassina TaxID=2675786 RepID=UPI001448E778|nr:FKBP-type peptidyl-prolyl cis-trans isomerase [Enterobacteriaceae endosymbiont of Donacia thalassina]QJC37432.1 FKBP-type peptidyl-prolyl cis-trans isomerase [Enterobacteriaceae endosymbiont of Donacia thalassina]
MKFFTKKASIFIILILSIGLNISTANALIHDVSWWNKNKTKTIIKKKIKHQKKKQNLKNKKKKEIFKNDNDKMSYALGIIIGKYLTHTYQIQKNLKILLDKKLIIQGVADSLDGKYKLSNDEIERMIQLYDTNIKNFTPDETQDEAKKNKIQGQKYIKKFLNGKNVKKSKSGLIYKINKMGFGKKITNNHQFIGIKYTGKLIDGTEFDSTEPNKPLYISLQQVIAGWKEGLKYIKKGGKITLVIPPKLAYGTEIISGIPTNSTLIFEIELIDIRDSISKK